MRTRTMRQTPRACVNLRGAQWDPAGGMKASFVTGGGGYVGRLLVQQLAKHGYSVTAFDLRFHETAKEQQSGVTYVLV